jgi:predicted esterase
MPWIWAISKLLFKKFDVLENEQTFIVAPEALNRFYLQGFTGRIGATWMTKEERLTEIEDYVNYLNLLYDKILAGRDISKMQINILGFSQGVATVCRWITSRVMKVDNLILWAGQLPTDMNLDLSKQVLAQTSMYVIYGLQDEFLTNISHDEYVKNFSVAGFTPQVLSFNGKHEIHRETLVSLRDQMTDKKPSL